MNTQSKALVSFAFLVLFFTVAVPAVYAQPNEYDAVCNFLKNKYQAKKVNIPFMWLARMAVGIVRPAGIKSFKVTVFRDLKFSRESLDNEMQAVMKDSFSGEWSPIVRVRSREGEQVYLNMRETGGSVKLLIVTIDRDQATVIRARFNPDKLAEFIENPAIFGISLDDNENGANAGARAPKKEAAVEDEKALSSEQN